MTSDALRARTELDPALTDGLLAAAASATAFREAVDQSPRLQEQRHFTELLIAQQPKYPPFLGAAPLATETETDNHQTAGAETFLAATPESILPVAILSAGHQSEPSPIEELAHVELAPEPAAPASTGLWSQGKQWLSRLFK